MDVLNVQLGMFTMLMFKEKLILPNALPIPFKIVMLRIHLLSVLFVKEDSI